MNYTQSFLKLTVMVYHLFLSPNLKIIAQIDSHINALPLKSLMMEL
jgi:hypothetical protein